MNTNLKVLYVVGRLPNVSFPSAQPFIASQIESLRKLGVIADVLDLSICCGDGWKKYLRGIFEVRKKVSATDYDLIHAHYSYCGWASMFQFKVPVVVSLMGSDLLGTSGLQLRFMLRGKFNAKTSQLLTKYADHIIVKSENMAKRIIHKKKVSVIPNGVDFELFNPVDRNFARRYFGFGMRQKVILFAADPGRPEKNYHLARESFDIVQNKLRSPCFLWPFYKRSQTELSVAMNAADVLIMTSVWEGSPNVVKEAMACNLPIVSVKVGDVAKTISGTRNCYLADYNPLDIAIKLALAIESGERSNGRQRIKYLRLDTVARQIIEKYNYVLKT